MIRACVKVYIVCAKAFIKLFEKVTAPLQSDKLVIFTNNFRKRLVYLKYDYKLNE